jgi:hypothetical protein
MTNKMWERLFAHGRAYIAEDRMSGSDEAANGLTELGHREYRKQKDKG